MDYGQNKGTSINGSDQPFFTAGSGNVFEPNGNPDLDNSLVMQENQEDIQNIVSPLETPSEIQERTRQNQEKSPELGEVINFEMPPTSPQGQNGENETKTVASFDESKLKTGEKLESSGIGEVDRVINQFDKNGDAASFNRTAREMALKNLKNSYGDNSAWKETA